MFFAIFYDISNDKTRRLAEKLCKKAGLVRLQRSVFAGRSDHWRTLEVKQQLQPLLNPKTDSLAIQPLDEAAYKRLQLIGKPMDKTDIARQQYFIVL